MSTLEQISGELRANGIREVVARIRSAGAPLSEAGIALSCSQWLGETFGELGHDEFLALELPAEPFPAALAVAQQSSERNIMKDDDAAGELPVMSGEQCVVKLNALTDTLHNARAIVTNLEREQRLKTRPALAACILAWQQGSRTPPTFETLIRETLASTAIERQMRVDGKLPPVAYKGGPSAYDKSRGHDGGVGAADRYVRRRMQRGGKRFTQGDLVDAAGRITAPLRPKLPSER